MEETEVKETPSTEEVEDEIPPLQRVGYLNRWVKDKYEVKIRIYDDVKYARTIQVYIGNLHVMSLLADKMEKDHNGMWFYRDGKLTAYLPLDEVIE